MAQSLLALASVLLLLLLRISPSAEAQNLSFSIQLIHIDSPISPLFNASQTPSDRLTNALQRSAYRVKRFKEAAYSSSPIFPTYLCDYLINLSLGTPPVQMLATFDTTSDLVWTQCEPCYRCYDQPTPYFDPKASSSYQNVACDSEACLSLKEQGWCQHSTCTYYYFFREYSSTSGIVATDTLTLGSTSGQPFSFEDTTIGCGTYNDGNFDGTGIVGFGQGPLSFFSRMKDLIDHKFSYCLAPSSSNHPSKLNFGSNSSEVSGAAVPSTPIISGEVDTYYYIRLESISVESGQILTTKSSSVRLIVDSGIRLTYLPDEMYGPFIYNLRALIPSEPVPDPNVQFDLCYKSGVEIPKIVMHFTGANVTLSDLNSVIEINGGLVCFAFQSSRGLSASLYGNTQQVNFLMSYDLNGKKSLSFTKTDCTKY